MKKILTVLLVLTLSVAGLFAATYIETANSTITLKAKIAEATPVFDFNGAKSGELDSVATKTIEYSEYPSAQEITADIRLTQINTARHKGRLKFTVTGNGFTSGTAATATVVNPAATIKTNHFSAADAALVVDATATSNQVTGTLTYSENKPVKEAKVLDMTFSWPANENLPAANDYKATVVISITDVF